MNARFLSPFFVAALTVTAATPQGFSQAQAPVDVCKPIVREVPEYAYFNGRMEAVESVKIQPRVSGVITKIAFKEGTLVQKGDLLYEIDAEPQQAEYDQAAAQVTLAEASLALARTQLDRSKMLLDKGALAKEDHAHAVAQTDVANANVQGARAKAQAARLRLSFTKIIAPIKGRIGRSHLSAGNLVEANKTNLAQIVAIDPIYVYFDVDERTALRLKHLKSEGKLKSSSASVSLIADDDQVRYPAVIDFSTDSVESRPAPFGSGGGGTSGAVRFRATLPNDKELFLPGMSAGVLMAMSDPPHKAMLIPSKCVMEDPQGVYVIVVGDKNAVVRRKIKIDRTQPGVDDFQIVRDGLNEGDRVIMSPEKIVQKVVVDPKIVPIPEPPQGDKASEKKP